ncbi:hypothetical protein [Stutzerimonas kunmingensis]|uniref:hypothetical protein n=1 Tax=Stutzerimonas kunmingensis TaxID=1211807 RepID=UPI00241C4408|nr:hypothetical protein [Stutzerimonas kunmingensis]
MSIYSGHRIQDHEAFVLCELFPLIMGYARTSGTPNEIVLVAAFMHLGAMLKNMGLSGGTLLECIDAAPLAMYNAPMGVH